MIVTSGCSDGKDGGGGSSGRGGRVTMVVVTVKFFIYNILIVFLYIKLKNQLYTFFFQIFSNFLRFFSSFFKKNK